MRYIVVDGLAVIAYGHLRMTKDVDIVIQLRDPDIPRAFQALAEIGYFPSVPIFAKDFANREIREIWRRDKGMIVLKMWSDIHQETPIDIFVYEPFDFDAEYQNAMIGNTGGWLPGSLCHYSDLVEDERTCWQTAGFTRYRKIKDHRQNGIGMNTPLPEIDWNLCTYEGAEREELRRWKKLTLREKLFAVEEMCDLARASMKSLHERGKPYFDLYTEELVVPPKK